MERCFVIQPFDKDKFDKRFDDTFAPAIEAAGLEPYRVDRDHSVRIPIQQIEEGIRNSRICLADITTDNPNVWFELGFALAVPKEIILVSSSERIGKYPFDVQHRHVLQYGTDSKSDYESLQSDITKRIKALLEKQTNIENIVTTFPVAETEGLTQNELVALVIVMENQLSSEYVYPYSIKSGMNSAGLADIAVSLAVEGLQRKSMIDVSVESDINGDYSPQYNITKNGKDWLLANQDKLAFKKPPESAQVQESDELPF